MEPVPYCDAGKPDYSDYSVASRRYELVGASVRRARRAHARHSIDRLDGVVDRDELRRSDVSLRFFGHFGLPALGIEGAAWATVVALWFRVAAYATWMMLPRYRVPYRLSAIHFSAPLMRRLVRFGGPNGLQLLVEVAGFTVFLLLF